MKKISTLFKKDPNDLGHVMPYIDPQNEWALTDGKPIRKYDGTSCAIFNGELYKRYDAKKNRKTGEWKTIPLGAIPCQEPDEITGHHPHWIRCERDNKADKYHFEAFDKLVKYYSSEVYSDTEDPNRLDGTYELCGEKIQGNPEKITGHLLIPHDNDIIELKDKSFEGIKEFLTINNIEGIVFHHNNDDRMCKIRKSDFGIKRIKN